MSEGNRIIMYQEKFKKGCPANATIQTSVSNWNTGSVANIDFATRYKTFCKNIVARTRITFP
jgi:hypothetical protein